MSTSCVHWKFTIGTFTNDKCNVERYVYVLLMIWCHIMSYAVYLFNVCTPVFTATLWTLFVHTYMYIPLRTLCECQVVLGSRPPPRRTASSPTRTATTTTSIIQPSTNRSKLNIYFERCCKLLHYVWS